MPHLKIKRSSHNETVILFIPYLTDIQFTNNPKGDQYSNYRQIRLGNHGEKIVSVPPDCSCHLYDGAELIETIFKPETPEGFSLPVNTVENI